jgi:hypothetical protein
VWGTFVRLWNFGAAALFLVIAALQLNDPDPIYWVLVYGGTAMIAFGQGLGSHSRFWTGACIGAVATGIISTAPAFGDYLTSENFSSIFSEPENFSSIFSGMGSRDYIENSREFLGLVLAFILLTTYSIKNS